MAQKIHQADIFGRIGSGIGQGLADQIPKEIERNRLASGLQQFERDSANLSPMHQLARLSSIPGITPQMIQTFGELSQRQNLANAYQKSASQPVSQNRRNLNDIKFGQPDQKFMSEVAAPEKMRSEEMSRLRSINQEPEKQILPIAEDQEINPLDPRLQAKSPWNPQKRDEAVADYIQMGFTPTEARQLQADDEARDLTEPDVYKQRQEYVKGVRGDLNKNLNEEIQARLQKTDPNVFSDISGNMLKNMEKAAYRDLISNKKATEKDIVEKWSKRALELAKTKGKFETMASTTGFIDSVKDAFKRDDKSLKQLKEYAKSFREANNSDEFYELLRSSMKMSPHGAASIAFEISPNVNKVLSSYKESKPRVALGGELPPSSESTAPEARRIAIEVGKNLTPEDSFLAIAQELSKKDKDFNAKAFFDQISEDRDNLGLTQRQKDELSIREKDDLLPYWGDFLVLPWTRRR